jgi:DNA-directed RNA polymerase alpha subunit
MILKTLETKEVIYIYYCNDVLERAYVSNIRNCTTCRECIRPEKFANVVDLGKIKDKFEFHVESVGIYTPADLVLEALKKLKEKANYWMEILEQEEAVDDEDAAASGAKRE